MPKDLNDKTAASRRAFLKGGALVAAPLGAAGAAAALGQDGHEKALARLRSEAAIRDLHQTWLRKVAAGDAAEAARLDKAVVAVAADHAGAPDEIALAADGQTATGRFHCLVQTQAELARDCTLAQMAHFQGQGMVRSTERRVLHADYVRTADGWTIGRLRSTLV
ncbi:MAG: hypothetical protein WDN45_03560 [Caulobacteraceae bacterium]